LIQLCLIARAIRPRILLPHGRRGLLAQCLKHKKWANLKPLLFKGGIGVVAMRRHRSRSELAAPNPTPTPPLKGRGFLQKPLSYIAPTVIIIHHDQSKTLATNPPIYANLGPVRFLSLNTVKFVKNISR
ncbi:MAG: hypothetical protein COZ43_10195, partial [Sphingomonadales bacterium CG_4_10_14_3_um_filter_58_15]